MLKKILSSLLSLCQMAVVHAAVPAPSVLSFPKGFLWGASTAGHQVEGGLTDNWTTWEAANAGNLAKTAESRYGTLANWSDIKQQATDPANYISGIADDSYDRYQEDLDLAQSLHLSAYRFSLEWSRIEPREGQFDETALAHYADIIAATKARGMEPFVTLYHWTEPTWFADKGGWEHSQAAAMFSTYADTVAKRLGPQATFWITLNEPQVYAGNSYLTGTWTPQRHNPFSYFRVMHAMIAAHQQAYASLKRANPGAQIGIANPSQYFEAYHGLWINRQLKALADTWYNFYFLDRIRDTQDFIGLNFYQTKTVDIAGRSDRQPALSDLGWGLEPEGIYSAALELRKYGKPIYVTENGLADATDSRRAAYIQDVARQLHRAIADGADVRGYLHWSLLDNFEWSEGFWPRFGLIAVDRATLARTVRPSAQTYSRIAADNSVSAP